MEAEVAQQISSTRQEVVADLEDDKTPYAEHKTRGQQNSFNTRYKRGDNLGQIRYNQAQRKLKFAQCAKRGQCSKVSRSTNVNHLEIINEKQP